ncbi:unnamed protein product, partial [Prunus brigantina]
EHISEVDYEKKELVPPKDVGLKIASVLLGEIGQGGVVDSNRVVDSNHQVSYFIGFAAIWVCRVCFFFFVHYVPKMFQKFRS